MPTEEQIKSREELFRTINQLKSAKEAADGRIGQLDQAVHDLRETVKAHELANGEANRHTPSGTDAEVLRSYVPHELEVRGMQTDAPHRLGGHEAPLRYDGRTYHATDEGVIRMLGGTDDVGAWEYGLLDDPEPKSEWQYQLQTYVDDLCLFRAVTGGRKPARMLARRVHRHLARGPGVIGRSFADNSGEGAEFIADVVVPRLFETMTMLRVLAANFARVPSTTGGNTTNPFLTTACQPFLVGTPASGDLNPAEITKSVPATASRSAAPKTFAVSMPVFRDAEEDSILEFGAFGRRVVALGLTDGEEDAIINSDAGTTHHDTGLASWAGPNSRWGTLGASNDHRKSWTGLRAHANDVSAEGDESASDSVAGLMKYRINLTSGHKFGDLMYILNAENYIAQVVSDSNVLTVDKYGPDATVLTGEISRIGGVPVVLSEFLTADLNATGVYDNTTKDYTAAILVDRTRWEIAERRAAQIEIEQRPSLHHNIIVATMRETFRTHDGSSTKNLYAGYKLAKS